MSTTTGPIEHLGERLNSSQFGHTMTRTMYGYPNRSPHQRFRRDQMPARMWENRRWQFQDEDQTRFSDTFLLWNRDRALRNYDLSLAYFDTLNQDDFTHALDVILAKARTLKPVEDLTRWNEVEGVYVMVFDNHKQFYIGQSTNIRKRIRQHWTGRKSFDRLIYGSTYDSILPIDEFRALDNTRIYAAKSTNPFALEERIERAADPRFCLNRMSGGQMGPLTLMLTGQIRTRAHTPTATPSHPGEHKQAWENITGTIATARTSDRDLALPLSALDMTLRVETDDQGIPHFWTNRDLIGDAAIDELITAHEYADFLTTLGETVAWPAKDNR